MTRAHRPRAVVSLSPALSPPALPAGEVVTIEARRVRAEDLVAMLVARGRAVHVDDDAHVRLTFVVRDQRYEDALMMALRGAGPVVNVHQGGGLGPVLFAP